ncbi:MAG: DUF2058 family protein [Granulosicoccus sp.]
MSDSLRDQLLKAGFAAPKAKPKPAPKSGSRNKKSGKHKPGASPSSQSTPSGTTPAQTGPRAGYTHVPDVPPKKKKSKKAPAVKPRAGSWSTRDHSASQEPKKKSDPALAEQRRAMKAAMQALIEKCSIKDFKGEEIYRFTLQNKIRELLVSESHRKQLANGELAITRLNGATCLVPAQTVIEIRKINPQWLVFLATDVEDSSDDDDEFPIPDDLVW